MITEVIHTDPLGRTSSLIDVVDATYFVDELYIHGPKLGWVKASSCEVYTEVSKDTSNV